MRYFRSGLPELPGRNGDTRLNQREVASAKVFVEAKLAYAILQIAIILDSLRKCNVMTQFYYCDYSNQGRII
jgi:hypothetical protein